MMSVAILDPNQRRAPTCVVVSITGAWENSPLAFFIDTEDTAHQVYTAVADIDGELDAISIPVPDIFNAGAHNVIVRSTSIGFDDDQVMNAVFVLAKNPTQPYYVGPDADPVEVPGALNSDGSRNWVLQDLMPGGLGSYIFPRNPRTLTVPITNRELSARHTTAVVGRHHIVEARDHTSDYVFTGLAFTEAEHDALQGYFDLNRRLYLIDHENRAWVVAFAHVDVTHRLRTRYSLPGQLAQSSDWVAEYTTTANVYGTYRTPVPLP